MHIFSLLLQIRFNKFVKFWSHDSTLQWTDDILIFVIVKFNFVEQKESIQMQIKDHIQLEFSGSPFDDKKKKN